MGLFNFVRKGALYTLEAPEEERIVKGRSMVGYGRRGFLAVLGAAIAAPAVAKVVPVEKLLAALSITKSRS